MLKDRLLILDLVDEGVITVPEAVDIIEAIHIESPGDALDDLEDHSTEIVVHLHIEN